MKLAIMQPYLFPYIGYFKLLQAVDEFVFFDDVNFIKKGWIHRNNILSNGEKFLFSIPLDKMSQNKKINETQIKIETYTIWKNKFLKTLIFNYKEAPYFESIYNLVESTLNHSTTLISELAITSIVKVARYLGISTNFIKSSSLPYSKNKDAQQKIIEICHFRKASVYLNMIGGKELYHPSCFEKQNISLKFLENNQKIYPQINSSSFVPNLSILDVLMNNSKAKCLELIHQKQVCKP